MMIRIAAFFLVAAMCGTFSAGAQEPAVTLVDSGQPRALIVVKAPDTATPAEKALLD